MEWLLLLYWLDRRARHRARRRPSIPQPGLDVFLLVTASVTLLALLSVVIALALTT